MNIRVSIAFGMFLFVRTAISLLRILYLLRYIPIDLYSDGSPIFLLVKIFDRVSGCVGTRVAEIDGCAWSMARGWACGDWECHDRY